MKRLLYFIVGAFCLAAMTLQLGSCSKKHATVIQLPDSVLVGKSLPTIDGTLSEYFSIVPQAYKIYLNDSILTLNVKVRHEKTYIPPRYVEGKILNPDSLISKYPYLVLVDSLGTPVRSIYMTVDTMSLPQLEVIMKGEPGLETELTFKSQSVSVDGRDSLADVAKNFEMVANLSLYADPATIDRILDTYQRTVAELNDWASGFSAGMAPAGYAAQIIGAAINEEGIAAETATSVLPFMSEQQKERYNKIKSSRTRKAWTL